jgi:molybdate transport system substrate-binding protein
MSRFGAIAVAAVLAGGCAVAAPSGKVGRTISVFAAASLEAATHAAAARYAQTHDGIAVAVSADASSALEAKLEQGAPADVFLSADTANPQRLVDAGLADGRVVTFAANRLALVVPSANPGAIETPADLARPGLRIIAAADGVPITRYVALLLVNLSGLPGYPPGFAAAYAANIVSREDNVSAVLAKVALAEADAGFVYATDAVSSNRVVSIPIPDTANVRAVYGGVVVRASRDVGDATEFLRWLAGSEGQVVLTGFGFLSP